MDQLEPNIVGQGSSLLKQSVERAITNASAELNTALTRTVCEQVTELFVTFMIGASSEDMPRKHK